MDKLSLSIQPQVNNSIIQYINTTETKINTLSNNIEALVNRKIEEVMVK